MDKLNFKKLNEELEKFIEKLGIDDLEMDEEDVVDILNGIIQTLPSLRYHNGQSFCDCTPEIGKYHNVIYTYNKERIAIIALTSYGKNVRAMFIFPGLLTFDFIVPKYMKKYEIADNPRATRFSVPYVGETKEEIIEDIVENLKRLIDYDAKIKEERKRLRPAFEKVLQDLINVVFENYHKTDEEVDLDIDLSNLNIVGETNYDKLKFDKIIIETRPNYNDPKYGCGLTYIKTSGSKGISNFYLTDEMSPWNITESMLEAFTQILQFLKNQKGDEELNESLNENTVNEFKTCPWQFKHYMICANVENTGDEFNMTGGPVQVQIIKPDEFETGEITDFENAYWFPCIEPNIYNIGEGYDIDITPEKTGSCSLQDALKAIARNGITPPPYDLVVRFLKNIESWAKTGTLDIYLEKYGSELKALCS